MEENLPPQPSIPKKVNPLPQPPVQTVTDTPQQMQGNVPDNSTKKRIVFALFAIILVMVGLAVLFNPIKSFFNHQFSIDKEAVQISITPLPTPNSKVTCAQFNNIDLALEHIDKACSLDLSHQNLSSLPPQISKLKNLSTIILNDNNFSDFPESLTSLNKLATIELKNNKITSVPKSILKLKNLQRLDLTNNKVTKVADEIPKSKHFIYLILVGNEIVKPKPGKLNLFAPQNIKFSTGSATNQ